MKRLFTISLIISALLLGACVKHPQNTKEFRDRVEKGVAFTTTDKYVIKRSYKDAIAGVKKYYAKCLNLSVSSTMPSGGSARSVTIGQEYYPKLIAGKDQAEFYMQFKTSAQAVGKVPEGGFYYMVFDFIKEGKNKTRVHYYGPSGKDPYANAVKGWADGTIKGCPGLTN